MATDEILVEFIAESKSLIDDMGEILDEIEGDPALLGRLADFSLYVDRIMGGAKNIAMTYDAEHVIHSIGNYTELCKIIGARAAKLGNNHQLYNICVAFLMDATEMLELMIDCLDDDKGLSVQEILSKTFLDRLRWINEQYMQYEQLEQMNKMDQEKISEDQTAIDDLLNKLGVI